jgi:hypothetical protein
MATGDGQISLPLAVGVDRGHLQWPDLFFFLFIGKVARGGRWVATSGQVVARGGSQPPPVAGSLSLFFFLLFLFTGKVVRGGRWVAAFGQVVLLFGCLI